MGGPAKKEMSRLVLALSLRSFQCHNKHQKPAVFWIAAIPPLISQAIANNTKAKAGSRTGSPNAHSGHRLPALSVLSVAIVRPNRITAKAPKKALIWCHCDMAMASPSDRCPHCGRISDRKRRFKRVPL